MPAILLVFTGFVLVASVLWWHLKRKNTDLPYPPGPPSDPLIGHLRVAPLKNHADVYHEWSKQYGMFCAWFAPTSSDSLRQLNLGDVLHLSVLGKSIVVLNTEEAAFELLDKRSAIYSDRIRFAYYDRSVAVGHS